MPSAEALSMTYQNNSIAHLLAQKRKERLDASERVSFLEQEMEVLRIENKQLRVMHEILRKENKRLQSEITSLQQKSPKCKALPPQKTEKVLYIPTSSEKV
jgi:chromosome segregation ATPase